VAQGLSRLFLVERRSIDLDRRHGFGGPEDHTLADVHLLPLVAQHVHADLFSFGFFPRKGDLGVELEGRSGGR
jgi:hypothetical protein